METDITPTQLDEVVRRIVEAVNPERIYLFGSRARGTATAASDTDLYIIADLEGSIADRAYQIYRLFPNRRFPLDVLVRSRTEFEKQRHWIGSMAYQIDREGTLLYERR